MTISGAIRPPQVAEAAESESRRHFPDPRIRKALEIVTAPGAQLLTIETLAACVGLSRSRLEHLFRQEIGVALGGLMRILRLDAAKKLLLDPSMRVKEIAIRCGYACTQDFTRAFKATFGLSPTEFRRSIES